MAPGPSLAAIMLPKESIDEALIQASIVTFDGDKNSESGTWMDWPEAIAKACPILPGAKPAPLKRTPSLVLTASKTLFSAGHQATTPAGAHCRTDNEAFELTTFPAWLEIETL